MLLVGCIIFVCEYFVLPVNDIVVYTLLAPVGEELVKSSVFMLFIVSFVEYRATREKNSKMLSFDALVFFVLLVFVFTYMEVFSPGNPLAGTELLFLFVKKFCGHFALTVVGCMVLGGLYQRDLQKRTVMLVISASLVVSMVLHSLVNQMGLGIYLGAMLHGVSQDMMLGGLSGLSIVLLVLFLVLKGREKNGNVPTRTKE
jgi:hypothetical protein